MFRNILVAFDGSPPAEVALQHAIDLAQAEGARLTVLTAVPSYLDVASRAAMIGGTRMDLDEVEEQLREDAKATLDAAGAQIPSSVLSETVVASGPPAQVVLEQVRKAQHDLVVMGSRGRTGIGAMLVGSVSHNVVHHSQVPVLIVPAHKDAEPLEQVPSPRGRG
jgi:nucleotide-binding universal stress UspA family protein